MYKGYIMYAKVLCMAHYVCESVSNGSLAEGGIQYTAHVMHIIYVYILGHYVCP